METIVNTTTVTEMRVDVRQMKSDIKELVAEQKFLKNQRKTINLQGERKIEPDDATYKHWLNRNKLRAMYRVYGIARGKTLEQIEGKSKLVKNSYEDKMLCKKVDELTKQYEKSMTFQLEV